MERARKQEVVAELNRIFSTANAVVVSHFSGLNAADVMELRGKMRDAGATFRVVKNSLVRLALKDTPCDAIADLFEGPTAISYSDDPVAAARATVKFSDKHQNLIVLGGIMDRSVLDAATVKSLAKLPSLDELRASFVGLLSTPATRIAGVLQAPAGQVARVLGAYGSQEKAA